MPTPRKPLLCRLNTHHKWVLEVNPDGEDYLHCTACGKDRYEFEFEHHDPTILGGEGSGGGMMGGGG
jgi:hypothetical protein